MTQTAARRRKDIQEMLNELLHSGRTNINEWLNLSAELGRGFSPQRIRDYYETGLVAREERRAERRIEQVTPRRESEIGELVFKRVEQTRESREERQRAAEGLSESLRLSTLLESEDMAFEREWKRRRAA